MSETARMKRIQVGGDLQAFCGRCKAERTHTVVSMKADTAPAEVICRTCHNQHRYRTGDSGAAGGGSRAKATGGRGGAPPPALLSAGPARAYSVKESFAAGERLEHPRYGLGRVEAARGAKIDVRFVDGVRTLIHGG